MKHRFKKIIIWALPILLVLSVALLGLYFSKNTEQATQVTENFPENTTNFQKGEYYFSAENYDLKKARHYYMKAISEDPQGEILQWYQLARIDFLEGDFDSSLHNLDKQIEYFDRQVPNIDYMYGLVYGFRADMFDRPQDFDLAQKHFKRFIEHDPTSQWARIDLSWIYFSQRKFENMIAALDPIYDQEQDNPWYLNMYGLALLNIGKTAQAVDHLSRAHELAGAVGVKEWSVVYPGNSPQDWEAGVVEFKQAVKLNLDIAQKRLLQNGDNSENNE